MTLRLGVDGRKFLVAASIGLFATGAACAQASEVIDVTIDFAKVLTLEEPAKTIVVGNPGIADAAVEDDTTVVLTGKAAGATNLIVLNAEGDEIVNAVLRVSSNVQQLTTVFYGSQRQTFSCAPTCEQVILVGDEPDVFKTATEQIQGRQQFATGQ
jgi:Flp pilus assembly secretin CpaC